MHFHIPYYPQSSKFPYAICNKLQLALARVFRVTPTQKVASERRLSLFPGHFLPLLRTLILASYPLLSERNGSALNERFVHNAK